MAVDMKCRNCGDHLGKQSEVEANATENGQRKGMEISIYCSNCGQSFPHTTQYDTTSNDKE